MPDIVVMRDSGGTWVPMSSAGVGSILFSNSQEGGANGVVATAGSGGNTGGGSGNYFNSVVGTVTFSNEHPANGLMGLRCNQDPTTAGPARVTWTGGTLGTLPSGTTLYLRAYIYWATAPTSTQTILQGRLAGGGGGAAFSVRYTTTGAIALYDSSNTVVYTSTGLIPTGKLVRVEVKVYLHATNGKIAAKIYYYDGAGHTMNGSVPVFTVGSETTGGIATRGSMDSADFGLSSSSTGNTLWTSDMAVGTSGWIGPTRGTDADFYVDSGGWIPGGQMLETSGGAWWGGPSVPNVPTGVANTLVGPAGWTTGWTPAATGAAATGFQVFLNGVQYGSDLPATTTSLAITGQSAGTYSVTVRAFNAAGWSADSSAATVTVTGPVGVPGAPTGVANTSVTSTGWTSSWTPAATGSAATGFRVFVDGVKYGSDLASTATSVAITGQAAGTYSVTVKAFNASGVSPASGAATVTVTGPTGVPNAPTGVSNTTVTSNGWTTNWTPAATGPAATGFRVFVNNVQYGADQPSTATSLDIAGQSPGTYSVKVKAFNATGTSAASAVVPVTISSGGPVPPGLIANRVIAGWYASPGSVVNDIAHAQVLMDPSNTNEGSSAWWQGTSAVTLPSGLSRKKTPAYKEFNPGGFINGSQLQANLDQADANGKYFLVQTTKVDNGDWSGVAAGNYDTKLDAIANVALSRAAVGGRGFSCHCHHEPYGKDINGTTRTYETWAAMQEYCSWYFAGYTTNPGGTADSTYHADRDTRSIMAYGPLPNGFLFTGTPAEKAALRKLLPDTLISAVNANNGFLAVDIYDNTTSGKTLADKAQAVYDWCHTYGFNNAGIAEMGAYSKAHLQAAWDVIKTKADLFRFCIYWDSGIGQVPGGATDWRLVPLGYPHDPVTPSPGQPCPFISVGTQVTQDLLTFYRDVVVPYSEAMA